MTNHRLQRVEDSVRSTLNSLLLTETRDPRLKLATVTSVEVSRDLNVANVAVSFSDPDQDRDSCMEALTRASGFFRHQLSQRLNLRHTPELRFRLDRGAEYAERIDNLLLANRPIETPSTSSKEPELEEE